MLIIKLSQEITELNQMKILNLLAGGWIKRFDHLRFTYELTHCEKIINDFITHHLLEIQLNAI